MGTFLLKLANLRKFYMRIVNWRESRYSYAEIRILECGAK